MQGFGIDFGRFSGIRSNLENIQNDPSDLNFGGILHRFLEGFRDVLEGLRMLFERIFSGCASAASERAQRAKRAERYSRERGDRTDQFENGHRADPPTRKAHRTGPKNAQESPKNRRRAASETNSMQKRWSARSAEAKQSDTDKNSGNSTFRRTSRMINTRDLRIRAFIAYAFQTSTRFPFLATSGFRFF